MSVDPSKVKANSHIGLFLDGYNNKTLVQYKERAAAEKLCFGSVERFFEEQRLQVLAVEEGFRRMGFEVDETGNIQDE